jgi:hypothetical protein
MKCGNRLQSSAVFALCSVLFSSYWGVVEGVVSYPMFMLVGESFTGGAMRKVDIPSTAVSTLGQAGTTPIAVSIFPANDFALFISGNTVNKFNLGSNAVTLIAGNYGSGSADGIGTAAFFSNPLGIKVSNDASFALVCDWANNVLRKIVLSNNAVSTIAGTLPGGYAEGSGLSIMFRRPYGVDISTDGSFAVVSEEFSGHRIRKIHLTTNPVTSSFIAGSQTGTSGFADGIGAAALFYSPKHLVISPDMLFVFVTDFVNCALRKIVISTGAVSTLSKFTANSNPSGLAWGGPYYLYVVLSYRIGRVALSTGNMSIFAGDGSTVGANSPNGLLASFKYPAGIAISKCSVIGYGVNSSSGMCSQCAANTYSITGSCVACPTKSSSVAGSTACITFICPAGNYYISTTIIQCASGTYFTGIDATVCTQCESGTFSTATGATLKSTCIQCTPGTYSTQNASASCSKCAAGTYSSTIGATSVGVCVSCDSGSYSSMMGADTCTPCPANSFCPQSSTQPTPCPGNATSPPSSAGYLDCTCAPGTSGFVANATYGRCVACTKGMFCAGAAVCRC